TAFTVNAGAALTVDNSSFNNTNRINDTAALTLNGGTFNFIGAPGTVSSESLATISLGVGNSQINTTSGTGGGSVALLSTPLHRVAGASVNFSGSTDLGTASNKILFSTAPTLAGAAGSQILAYGTVSGPAGFDLATYGSATVGITRFTAYNTSAN